MAIQFSAQVLDQFIAPECSELTSCDIPALSESPNYWGTFFQWNVGLVDRPPPMLAANNVFLRRYMQSVSEFIQARECILKYIESLPQAHNIAGYLRALSHFEQAVALLRQAILSRDAVTKLIRPLDQPQSSERDSDLFALNQLYNAIKHFDEDITKGKKPHAATPIWIVRDGLKCFSRSQANQDQYVVLPFVAMVAIYEQLGRMQSSFLR